MQEIKLPPKNGKKPSAARRVLAGAVVASLFAAPTVTSAFAAPTDLSEAFGKVINADGLTLDVAEAGYSYSANPSSSAAQENPLNLALLNESLNLELGDLTLPVIGDDGTGLIQLGQAGALSSYALADTPTHAKASAGVLGGDGALAVDGNTAELASIDLTRLFSQVGVAGLTNEVLDVAELQLGALGSTTERTDGADPTHEYKIASATVDLHSPLLSQLSDDLTATTTTLGTALDGIVGDGGLTQTISNSLNAVNVNLFLAEIGLSNANLVVNGLDDATGTLNAVLAQELVSETGAVSLNLGEGTVHIDLSKIITGGLNDQPANTPLLDDETAALITAELTALLNEVTTNLTDAVDEILAEASFTLTADVDAVVLGRDLVTGGVNISGSLSDLLNGNSDAFTLANDLTLLPGLGDGINVGSLLDSVLELVLGVTGPAFQGVNTLLDGYPAGVQTLVTDVVAPVVNGAVEPLLEEVLEITLNEQGTVASTEVTVPASTADSAAPAAAQVVDPAPEGELNYVTALAIDVLPVLGTAAVGVDLGTSAVRAAAEYADVIITSPVPTDTFTDGDDVVVTGTGEPNTDIEVSLDGGNTVTVTTDENGDWTTTFPAVPEGEHTITATDGSSQDQVTITVDPADTGVDSTADATADSTADATADSTADATADATADSTADATADATADSTADATADATADSTADATADSTADATADSTADATADATADSTADATADATADSTADASADATADSTADASADATADAEADATTDAASEGDSASNGSDDDSSPDGKNDDKLADTGASGVLLAGGAAVLLALAGAGIMIARRKRA